MMNFIMICATSQFHWYFYHSNSNAVEISLFSQPNYNKPIATDIYTWHNGYSVVLCAKVGSDITTSNEITVKRIFHRIRIVTEKILVKY